MKKHLITYYIILILIPIYGYYNCIKIINSPYITSVPWNIGIIYPTCYLTFLLIFISLLLKFKYKRNKELVISLCILILQIIFAT